MDYEKKIDIPFGAFDSELYYQEINIPDGFEATIKDNKIILKRKESEDERMVKFIKNQLFNIKKTITEDYELDVKLTKAIDWLEKQGDKLQDKSALEAIQEENADKCNCVESTNKTKPKFHLGDWIIYGEYLWKVIDLNETSYTLEAQDGEIVTDDIKYVDSIFRLWTSNDAKNGDVLTVTMYPEGTWIGIFKEHNGCTFSSYCFVNTEGTFKLGTYNHGNGKAIHPATKEQRDTFFIKMKEAGYIWDNEKKELKLLITNGGDF